MSTPSKATNGSKTNLVQVDWIFTNLKPACVEALGRSAAQA
jgi:hypothetical protein